MPWFISPRSNPKIESGFQQEGQNLKIKSHRYDKDYSPRIRPQNERVVCLLGARSLAHAPWCRLAGRSRASLRHLGKSSKRGFCTHARLAPRCSPTSTRAPAEQSRDLPPERWETKAAICFQGRGSREAAFTSGILFKICEQPVAFEYTMFKW